MERKRITMQNLADLINQVAINVNNTRSELILRINGQDKNFLSLENRFDGLGTRFDGFKTKFDGFENRFDGLGTRFDGFKTKFDGFERKFNQFDTKFTGLFLNLDERLASVEERLVKTEVQINGLYKHIDGFVGLHKKIDTEQAALAHKYHRLENRVEVIEKRRS